VTLTCPNVRIESAKENHEDIEDYFDGDRFNRRFARCLVCDQPGSGNRLLIATQGSGFKSALIDSVTVYLIDDSLYVRVIDVTGLGEIDDNEWNAILIVHTTEQWKLQPDVAKYLERARDLSKVIVVTTSGSGEWKSDEYAVDVITSASKSDELPALTQKIVAKLRVLLQ